jgi:allantoin racemase
VRIWFQLVSSTHRLPKFLAEVQRQCDLAAAPGTKVDVRGTQNGALGDHYASLLHFDADEILRLAHSDVLRGGYDVYALANSLDPALDGLRELLDIPVLSAMQVACSLAPMLGDKFGIIVPNDKFTVKYRDVVASYGLAGRLAGVRPLGFDRIADHNSIFEDEAAATAVLDRVVESGRELIAEGAEVLMVAGISGSVVSQRGLRAVDAAPILDIYAALVKVSEAMGVLARDVGATTSRVRRYRQPPAELLTEAMQTYGLTGVRSAQDAR